MNKTAVITGVTGQDGSYLAELLLQKGYRVIGLTRSPDASFTKNIQHLAGRMELVFTTYEILSLIQIFKRYEPAEVYNLTGQSFVSKSWEMVEETLRSAGLIPIHILEAVVNTDRKIRFFQASSCEVYFPEDDRPLTEDAPITPYNPYGCSKALGLHAVRAYRKNYNLFAANGVLFGHESSRRHEAFLSKKIALGAARIKKGLAKELKLGNLEIRRDWGYAPDYVDAMHRMLQLQNPEDFNICYGESRSVKDMAAAAFAHLDLDYTQYVRSDAGLVRPFEPKSVTGSNAKAKKLLDWTPQVTFEKMMQLMVDHELKELA